MRIRRLIVPAVVLGAAAYFGFLGGEYTFFDVRRIERQQLEEQQRLALLQDSVKVLRARADSLERDPAVLEKLARERYGMIREGERLYRFAADTAGSGRAAGRTP